MDIASLHGERPSMVTFFASAHAARRRLRGCVDSRSSGERCTLMRRTYDTFMTLLRAAGTAVPALVLGLAVATALVASPGVAQASPQDVLRDCAQDGKLDHHYSISDLKKAEKKLPTDVDEYTNCRDVINQAEVQGSGGNGHGEAHGAGAGSGGSGGGGSASPRDAHALHKAKSAGGQPPSLSLHRH